jgi:dinuclear metal center YbgI/SA1388 family protein
MDLADFISVLERLAPLGLAEDWDNVGPLLVPSDPRPVERVLLTVDLTGPVLEEATLGQIDAIVAYHPPIWNGFKRLSPSKPRERVIIQAIERGLVVYSPHTALDAVVGGVNDWLAAAFPFARKRAIRSSAGQLEAGQGRFLELETPIALDAAVLGVKTHLGLSVVRVATSARHRDGAGIATVSLCAGAGGGVVAEAPADLYLTGEMRHHDVLLAVEQGRSVILCEHTNSERGYLALFAESLRAAGLVVSVSVRDRDPLAPC